MTLRAFQPGVLVDQRQRLMTLRADEQLEQRGIDCHQGRSPFSSATIPESFRRLRPAPRPQSVASVKQSSHTMLAIIPVSAVLCLLAQTLPAALAAASEDP